MQNQNLTLKKLLKIDISREKSLVKQNREEILAAGGGGMMLLSLLSLLKVGSSRAIIYFDTN